LLRGSVIPRAVAFAIFATAAVGCRSIVALPLLAAALALLSQSRDWRERVSVSGIVVGIGAFVLLPFFALAPSAFVFFNVKYHLESALIRPLPGRAVEWWVGAPLSIILCFTGLAGVVSLVRKRLWTELLLLLGALLGIVVPMLPVQAYGEYALPSMLVAGATGIAALWATGEGPRFSFRHVVWVMPLLVLLHPLPDVLPDAERTAGRFVAAGRFVREHAPAGPILASIPIVAVEAGRDVIPGTEMGQFAVMGPKDAARAKSLHLTTLDDLTSTVRSRAPAAIVKLVGRTVNWNFGWQIPALSMQPAALDEAFEQAIDADYTRAFVIANVEVLLRRQ
jgi:hypothetical protein